jgi:serine/threonine protein kinase
MLRFMPLAPGRSASRKLLAYGRLQSQWQCAAATMTEPPGPGQQFGDFTIVEKLGEGGMGIVYRARQDRLRRDVALKILRLADPNGDETRRFLRESRLHSGLSHPNLVCVFDAGEVDGLPYIAMELVQGDTLRQLITDSAPLDPSWSLRTIQHVFEALIELHQVQIIHRDVKPANILLAADGRVKLSDLGLSWQDNSTRFTQPGAVVGTAGYMAPELFSVSTPTSAIDVYACGVSLYQCLSGTLPVAAAPNASPGRLSIRSPLKPLSHVAKWIPAQVDNFVMGLLDVDPGRRPDAQTASREINRLLDDPAIGRQRPHRKQATPESPPTQRRRSAAFGRNIAVLLGALALAVGLNRIGTRPDTVQAEERARDGLSASERKLQGRFSALKSDLVSVRTRLQEVWNGPGAVGPEQSRTFLEDLRNVESQLQGPGAGTVNLDRPNSDLSPNELLLLTRCRNLWAVCWSLRAWVHTLVKAGPPGRRTGPPPTSSPQPHLDDTGNRLLRSAIDTMVAALQSAGDPATQGHASPVLIDSVLEDTLWVANQFVTGVLRGGGGLLRCPIDGAKMPAVRNPLLQAAADIWMLDWLGIFSPEPELEDLTRWLRISLDRSKRCNAPQRILNVAYRRAINSWLSRAYYLLHRLWLRTPPANRIPQTDLLQENLAECIDLERKIAQARALIEDQNRIHSFRVLSYAGQRLLVQQLEAWILKETTRRLLRGAPKPAASPSRDDSAGVPSVVSEIVDHLDEICSATGPTEFYVAPRVPLMTILTYLIERRQFWGLLGPEEPLAALTGALANARSQTSAQLGFGLEVATVHDRELFSGNARASYERRLTEWHRASPHGPLLPSVLEVYLERLAATAGRWANVQVDPGPLRAASPRPRHTRRAGGEPEQLDALVEELGQVSQILSSLRFLQRDRFPISVRESMIILMRCAVSFSHLPPDSEMLVSALVGANSNIVSGALQKGRQVESILIDCCDEWFQAVIHVLSRDPQSDAPASTVLVGFMDSINDVAARLNLKRLQLSDQRERQLDRSTAWFQAELGDHAADSGKDLYRVAAWFWSCGLRRNRADGLAAVQLAADRLEGGRSALKGLRKRCQDVAWNR